MKANYPDLLILLAGVGLGLSTQWPTWMQFTTLAVAIGLIFLALHIRKVEGERK
jgi:asparagine N-glycosylation enzyme membrane subunit Stt3